jgi:hypothetical protein
MPLNLRPMRLCVPVCVLACMCMCVLLIIICQDHLVLCPNRILAYTFADEHQRGCARSKIFCSLHLLGKFRKLSSCF